MPHITAILNIHEELEFTPSWKSKPADRYELNYHLQNEALDHTLYHNSLRHLFKDLFQKTGRFDMTYTLEFDQAIEPDRKNSILKKFNQEYDHFLRKILKLKADTPLPKGNALKKALENAAAKQKMDYQLFLEKQLIEVTETTHKLHGVIGIVGICLALGLGTLLIGAGSGAKVGTTPIALLSVSLTASIGFYWLTSFLQKNYVRNTEKIIQDTLKASAQEKTVVHTQSASSPNPTAEVETPTPTSSFNEPPQADVIIKPSHKIINKLKK